MVTSTSGLLTLMVLIATAASGLMAGIGVNQVIIDFPARRKLGTLAYADFERSTDLGNGVLVYPVLAIGGALLKGAALIAAFAEHAPAQLLILLGLAFVFGLLILVTTAFAAPQMLRIGRTENREALIAPLLERFVRVSRVRAILIWLDFAVLLWAILVL